MSYVTIKVKIPLGAKQSKAFKKNMDYEPKASKSQTDYYSENGEDINLYSFSVPDLKQICRDFNIIGFSKLNKGELVQLILSELHSLKRDELMFIVRTLGLFVPGKSFSKSTKRDFIWLLQSIHF